MIEIYTLAEKIYGASGALKSQKSSSLIWKKNREKWFEELEKLRTDVFELEEILDYSYSEEHFGLIKDMKDIIDACEEVLRQKRYGYKAKCTNYMQAFHSLPRAFFSPENYKCASVTEARGYAEFWLRICEK